MLNIKHPTHIIISSLIVAVLSYIFVFPLFQYLVLDKNAINSETTSFKLADSFQLKTEKYLSGFCFDGCPSTQITYSVKSVPNSKVLDDIEATFARNGYQQLIRGDNTIRGNKNNGRYHVEAITLREGTGYAGVKDEVLVDMLVVNLTYNHNISEQRNRQTAHNEYETITTAYTIELLNSCKLQALYYGDVVKSESIKSEFTKQNDGIVLVKLNGSPYNIQIAERAKAQLLPVAENAKKSCPDFSISGN